MGVETLDVDESLYSILTMTNNGTWQIIQRFPLHMCPNSVQNENRAKFLFHASEQRMKKDRDIKQRQKTV